MANSFNSSLKKKIIQFHLESYYHITIPKIQLRRQGVPKDKTLALLTENDGKVNTSAFFIFGSRWRFTKIYHKESPARGSTYKASSLRLAFFSINTDSADIPPAIQYKSLWSFDATFLCKHMTP